MMNIHNSSTFVANFVLKDPTVQISNIFKSTLNENKDWVQISPDGSTMKVSSWTENKYGNIKCHWRDVFRDGDFEVKLGPMLTEGKQYELDKSDHVLVNCSTMSDNWTQMVTGLRKNISIKEVRTLC